MRSAIILAGGSSKRLGRDKALIKLAGKTLILHVIDSVSKLVDEIVVVTSIDQKLAFERLLDYPIVMDEYEMRSPLIGALTGFKNVQGEYSMLLPCDTPFISDKITSILFDLCIDMNAVIPRRPNGFIEPLQAVYRTKQALDATKTTLRHERFDFRSLIKNLEKIKYVSTTVLQQVDSELLTFFNINTHEDLRKSKTIMEERIQTKD